MSDITDVVFIGAGNLAYHLAPELMNAGYNILQVYSRTNKSARDLAVKLSAEPINEIKKVNPHARVYILALSDEGMVDFIKGYKFPDALFFHTSGGLSIDIFKNKVRNYGVMYPLQTFIKTRPVDFTVVPVCVEGCNEEVEDRIYHMASQFTGVVRRINSERRQILHLAAVFACNFTNHMYAIANAILQEANLEFDLMQPLVKETAGKVMYRKPGEVQTGPAIRNDKNILEKHLDLLSSNARYREIYKSITNSIQSSLK